MTRDERIAQWESLSGDKIYTEGPCAYRRGYVRMSDDCMNCRYNRMCEGKLHKSECVAKNFVLPLSEMDNYLEMKRNEEHRLVMKGQQSEWLDWFERNKDKMPKKKRNSKTNKND